MYDVLRLAWLLELIHPLPKPKPEPNVATGTDLPPSCPSLSPSLIVILSLGINLSLMLIPTLNHHQELIIESTDIAPTIASYLAGPGPSPKPNPILVTLTLTLKLSIRSHLVSAH